MKDDKVYRTGIIDCEDETFIFYLSNYKFQVMTDKIQNYEERILFTLTPEDGFIHGYTHSGRRVAIYCNDNNMVVGYSTQVDIASYLVADRRDCVIDYFDTIEFSGGTLNNLFLPQSLQFDPMIGRDTQEVNLKIENDCLSYELNTVDFCCNVSIFSTISPYWSIMGSGIKNNGNVLRLHFSEKLPVREFYKHYQEIKRLISFMTFRNNVGFESIHLYQQEGDKQINKMKVFIREAEVLTDKDVLSNISFEDLGESIIPLLQIFYSHSEQRPMYSLGFYPDNDAKYGRISNMQVRSVCSAIECELRFAPDLHLAEDEKLKELIANIKTLVKEHRDSSQKLEKKTYDMIFSNIDHWSMSLSDQIMLLYKANEEEMKKLPPVDIPKLNDKKIQDFVKYRNSITHGANRELTLPLAATAYLLCGLVYCSILKRINLPTLKIQELCRDKLLR